MTIEPMYGLNINSIHNGKLNNVVDGIKSVLSDMYILLHISENNEIQLYFYEELHRNLFYNRFKEMMDMAFIDGKSMNKEKPNMAYALKGNIDAFVSHMEEWKNIEIYALFSRSWFKVLCSVRVKTQFSTEAERMAFESFLEHHDISYEELGSEDFHDFSKAGFYLGINDKSIETLLESSSRFRSHTTIDLPPISADLLAEKIMNNHLLVVGKSGSGKSTALMEIALAWMRKGNFVLMIDPHSSLAGSFYLHAINEGHHPAYITPKMNEMPGINPFSIEGGMDAGVLAGNIAQVFHKMSSMSNEYFGYRMQRILEIMSYVTIENHGNMEMLYSMLTDSKFRTAMLSSSMEPMAQDLLEEITKLEKRYPDILTPALARISAVILNKNVRQYLSPSKKEVSISRAFKFCDGMVFDLDEASLGVEGSSLTGSILIIYLFLKALAGTFSSRETLLVIDELNVFTTPMISSILSEGRKYHLHLLVATQGIDLLQQSVKDALKSNVNNMLYFNASNNDAKYFADSMASFENGSENVYRAIISMVPYCGIAKTGDKLYSYKTMPSTEYDKEHALLENNEYQKCMDLITGDVNTEAVHGPVFRPDGSLTELGIYKMGGFPRRGASKESPEHAALVKMAFSYFAEKGLHMEIPDQGKFYETPDGEVIFLDEGASKNPAKALEELRKFENNEYWKKSDGRNINVEAEHSGVRIERIEKDVQKAIKKNRYLVIAVYSSEKAKVERILNRKELEKYREFIKNSVEVIAFENKLKTDDVDIS